MDSPRTAGRTPLRRTRLAIVLIPVTALIALLAWAFASPIGSSPDDDYHLASIWCAQGERAGLCEPGSADDRREIPRTLIYASKCYAFDAEQSAECVDPSATPMLDTNRGNFEAIYPPVFYSVMSPFASTDIQASVIAMRAFNAVLFVGLITTTFFLVARWVRAPLLWGAVIPIVPLGIFLVPSVNPSSWAILSAVVLWPALVGFFAETRRGPRIALAAISVLATVMAAGARSDAAVYSGIAVVVAVAYSFQRTRRFALSLLLPALLAVVALAFFLTSGQSAVINPDTAVGDPEANVLGLAIANFVLLPNLWSGALGTWGLGWLDTAMPGLVWGPAITLFAVTVFFGLRTLDRRKLIAVGIVALSLVVIPMYVLIHDGVLIGSYVQPRYIYPLMIMLLGLCALGIRRADLRFNRVHLTLIVGGLAAANAAALHTNIRRYVTGTDVHGFNLDDGAEWWWQGLAVGPNAIVAVGAIAYAACLIALAVVARTTSLAPDGESESSRTITRAGE